MLHWLILVPCYFFAALTASLLLLLTARLLRLRVASNVLLTTAVVVALVAILAPLLAGWAEIDDYSLPVVLALGAASFTLAAFDTLLRPRLPLPLDREIEAL